MAPPPRAVMRSKQYNIRRSMDESGAHKKEQLLTLELPLTSLSGGKPVLCTHYNPRLCSSSSSVISQSP